MDHSSPGHAADSEAGAVRDRVSLRIGGGTPLPRPLAVGESAATLVDAGEHASWGGAPITPVESRAPARAEVEQPAARCGRDRVRLSCARLRRWRCRS